ncbi:hypothetical protein CLPU_4c00230 [Gottschalkia purinilytica]|uniref:GyrI-like small molecule binding domain-containing protein n=1 Tax=Gottschalkia purinilytica TaxID=1503 RepID=A0A0L0WBX6_GOTPU|nr:GyrI-like domain-containing protein [Gottschalkia purinilytica]KNF08977.1 hypothetical protein CLPU_4c00230 [Gottschalkia purinilytica]
MNKKLDYKKEYKDLYQPKSKPSIVNVPEMNFIMVSGKGDPNSEVFQQAVELLYGLSFTIKMSKMKGNQPEGYFEYVMPPLEGLWWIEDGEFSFRERDNWVWAIMIRQPEFVTDSVFQWACNEYKRKKGVIDLSKVSFETYNEGLCVQAMHRGSYKNEPETVEKMKAFMVENNLEERLMDGGKHHEIYLSDPRKTLPEKLRTIIRHPVKEKIGEE